MFEEGELNQESTVAFFATVQQEGGRQVERDIAYYNLDMIISVGYRVKSYRGVQFRIWATQVLKEYLIKGFALNDELLKSAGGGNYFDELLSRIRDIRSSERFSIARCWKFMRSVNGYVFDTLSLSQWINNYNSQTPYDSRCLVINLNKSFQHKQQ